MTGTVLLMSRLDDQMKARRWLANPPSDAVVRFGKATRTDRQNRKLWPMLQDIQRQVADMGRFSLDDIKLRFLNALGVELRFLPMLEGEGMFPVGLKSSTLTKLQFAGLIELLYAYGAKNGVVWSEPKSDEDQLS